MARNIEMRTDNRSLFDAIQSTTPVEDKRLRVDMAILREMLIKGEIEHITWKPRMEQLADCLTKAGASPDRLFQVLDMGKF